MSQMHSTYSAAYRRAESAARQAERKRILAILALPEARPRWSFAVWLGTMTDATVDEARHRLQTDGVTGAATAVPASSALVEGMKARFAASNTTAVTPPRPVSAAPGSLADSMRRRVAP